MCIMCVHKHNTVITMLPHNKQNQDGYYCKNVSVYLTCYRKTFYHKTTIGNILASKRTLPFHISFPFHHITVINSNWSLLSNFFSLAHQFLMFVPIAAGRLKMWEWKKRYGQKCKGGKCRSRLVVSKAEPRLYSETALSYFLKIVLRLLTE